MEKILHRTNYLFFLLIFCCGVQPVFAEEDDDAEDASVEYVIVEKPEAEAAKKTNADPFAADYEEDPDFEIVRKRKIRLTPEQQQKTAQEDREKQQAAARAENEKRERTEWCIFGHYQPYYNTINGVDARWYIAGFLVSVASIAAMLIILFREMRRMLPEYSVDEMRDLRRQGMAVMSEQDADSLTSMLCTGLSKDKDDEGDPIFLSRAAVNSAFREIPIVASTLPTDPDRVDELNKIAKAANIWQSRMLITPGLNIDSGIIKRILMAIVYIIVICLYYKHPMFLLVLFSPLAFWTPIYLLDERVNSKVYSLLGGSLKMMGRMTSGALAGAARGEGETVTVYSDGYGNKYVEHNFSGILILFALRIALIGFIAYLVYLVAPLLVLYAIVRNYILAR